MNDKEALQSKVIDYLRFPMAMMVIFIHLNPVLVENTTGFGDSLFNVIGSAGSHVLSHIAVPMFFFFSGYLYFFRTENFGREVYLSKTKKRFKSLVLPYFYWNLIAFCIIALLKVAGILVKGKPVEGLWEHLGNFSFHTFWDEQTWAGGWRCFGLIEAANNTAPQDVPLWFLRNLIIIILLAPLIHWLIRKFGKATIALLGLAYLSNIWIDYMPLAISGFFFFSLGSYMSINRLCIEDCFGKGKVLVAVIAVVTAVICVYLDIPEQDKSNLAIIRPIFVLCGVITAYNIMHWLVASGKYKYQWPVLAQSSFFVFAIHSIRINGYGMSFANKGAGLVFFFSPTLASIVGYLAAPFVTGAACVLIYVCMKKYTPRLLGALTGNR